MPGAGQFFRGAVQRKKFLLTVDQERAMFKNILFVVSSLTVVLTADVLHAQTLPSTLIVSNVSYNAAGAITQINYGNGNVTSYIYNDLNLRLNRIKTINNSSQTIQDLNYTYDALGNILSITKKVTVTF